MRIAVLLLVAVFLASCASGPRGLKHRPGARERGLATWYGKELNGRRTASGERFDMNAYTAAHRTLPFGTRVRVVNLRNGRAVVVRVNDRGPYGRGYIIDLSRAAAEHIGMIRAGSVTVEVEVLGGP